jgi:hypothetical protein
MSCVARAPATVLLQLHPVASVLPILLCDVVTPLALGALERYVDATITCHGHLSKFRGVESIGARLKLLGAFLTPMLLAPAG